MASGAVMGSRGMEGLSPGTRGFKGPWGATVAADNAAMPLRSVGTPAVPAPAGTWSRARPASMGDARSAGLALVYLAAFLLLDWVSYFQPLNLLDITPWSPEPALAIALLVRRPSWWWWVGLTVVASDGLIRGLPAGWAAGLAAGAAVTATYAGMAAALRRHLDRSMFLAGQRDLLRFVVIVGTGTLAGAIAYLISYAGLPGPRPDLSGSLVRHWLGNAVGVLVILPILLVLMDPVRRPAVRTAMHSRTWWTVVALIVALLSIVVEVDVRQPFRHFYLLLLPLAWLSLRQGLVGAVLSAALLQVGLVLAVALIPEPDHTAFELQLRMATIALTALALGLVVDQRERAQAQLRGSLHMVAAGQMAAAIAHELSQPLTALGQYAQAARMLRGGAAQSEDERRARVDEVMQRMAAEGMRAGEVVKRLREFFRTGGTQLAAVDAAALVRLAVQEQSRRADLLDVNLAVEIEPGLPRVHVDAVQIEMVLRNLLANALDAVDAAGPAARAAARSAGRAHVTVHAAHREGQVRIEVEDCGDGVAEERLPVLFEAGASGKAGGMGIGLSICRAIVEAHGGRLWAEPGPGGHFCFTLETLPGEFPGDVHAS